MSKIRFLLFLLLLTIAGVRYAHAIDQNSNGISDVWEAAYPSVLANLALDHDGDGRTSAQEGIDGTNPLNPTDYFHTTSFTRSADGSTATLIFRSVLDRYYEIEESDDLTTWNYSAYASGAGTSTIATAYPDPTAPRKFFRVRPYPDDDYDSDNDGLFSWEDVLLGTDPYSSDSDADGMPDGWEFIHQLNPLSAADAADDLEPDGLTNYWEFRLGYDPRSSSSGGGGTTDGERDFDNDGLSDFDELHTHNTNPSEPDTDGDGATDGDEIRNGTDPNSATSYSPVWRGVYSSLQYDFDDYPPNQGGRRGYLSITASWNAALNMTTAITSEIAWPTLGTRLDTEAPLPTTKPAQTGGLAAAYGYANLIPNPPCYHATLQHERFWIEIQPAATAEVLRTVLLLTERTVDGQASTPVIQPFSMRIPAGSTVSQSVSLLPAFISNPTGNTSHGETVNMSVNPVELILDKNKLDLLDAQKWEVKISGSLPTGTVTNYKFEMRRATESTRYEMQNGASAVYNEKPRVAGKFKVSAVLTVNGQNVTTDEKDLEVQFPDASKILSGTGVQARMNQAWQATLAATTPTSRREEGYYITLDTNAETYGITAHTIATPVGNTTTGGWDTATSPRPADVPASPVPTDKPVYTVAWYHTHTPTLYRSGGRGVGPSSPDFGWSASSSINSPGYAHDYVESPAGSGVIPAGHPLNSAFKVYNITPPDRRPTP
jgi:hypothetical protein